MLMSETPSVEPAAVGYLLEVGETADGRKRVAAVAEDGRWIASVIQLHNDDVLCSDRWLLVVGIGGVHLPPALRFGSEIDAVAWLTYIADLDSRR